MLLETNVPNYVKRSGKVRDLYELGHTLMIIITTDRISAFDHVFPNGIPNKGKILNALCKFWAEKLDVYYHCISTDLQYMPEPFRLPEFAGRIMMVEKADVIPFECVVRGYLTGSAWEEYRKSGEICGVRYPAGLQQYMQFPRPIFTPAIKAKTGHDINVSFSYMADQVGFDVAAEIEQKSIELYLEAAEHAWHNGVIIADSKLEWGKLRHVSDELVLIDEMFTPDSARFWSLSDYVVGSSTECHSPRKIPSFDKQFLRDWVAGSGWDRNSPPPPIPEEIVQQTLARYKDAYKMLVGVDFSENQI